MNLREFRLYVMQEPTGGFTYSISSYKLGKVVTYIPGREWSDFWHTFSDHLMTVMYTELYGGLPPDEQRSDY